MNVIARTVPFQPLLDTIGVICSQDETFMLCRAPYKYFRAEALDCTSSVHDNIFEVKLTSNVSAT